MSLKASHPISQQGVLTRRWAKWRRDQGTIAKARSLGFCEAASCSRKWDEVHHVFARGHIVSEPLASHNAFLVALCKQHHDDVTEHPGDLTDVTVMVKALIRAVREWQLEIAIPLENRKQYVAAAREIERQLREDSEQWRALVEASGKA